MLALDNYDDEVCMWVFEEEVNGKKLTEIINTEHENVKYLPVRLPCELVPAARCASGALARRRLPRRWRSQRAASGSGRVSASKEGGSNCVGSGSGGHF